LNISQIEGRAFRRQGIRRKDRHQSSSASRSGGSEPARQSEPCTEQRIGHGDEDGDVEFDRGRQYGNQSAAPDLHRSIAIENENVGTPPELGCERRRDMLDLSGAVDFDASAERSLAVFTVLFAQQRQSGRPGSVSPLDDAEHVIALPDQPTGEIPQQIIGTILFTVDHGRDVALAVENRAGLVQYRLRASH
jgi:hypothetical protein